MAGHPEESGIAAPLKGGWQKMSKATPGPWIYNGEYEILSDNDEVLDPYIADVISVNGNYTDENEAERIANARLIAAAPDLLEALEGLLQWLNSVYPPDVFVGGGDEADMGVTHVVRLRKLATSAIAKTRGE